MNKVIEHIKNNAAVYLIIFVTLVVVCILLFKPEPSEKNDYDTSMFNVVDIEGANKLFSSNQDQLLFIGRSTCTACQSYIKELQEAKKRQDFYVSYLDIEEIDTKSEAYSEFLSRLDMQYTYGEVTGPFSKFMGSTPMIVIIKDNKMEFGILGSMSTEATLTIVNKYLTK